MPPIRDNDPEKKFEGGPSPTEKSGVLLLTEYLASFELTLRDTIDAGDHTLFIGEVLSAHASSSGVPATTLDYGKTYIGDH